MKVILIVLLIVALVPVGLTALFGLMVYLEYYALWARGEVAPIKHHFDADAAIVSCADDIHATLVRSSAALAGPL